MAQVALTAAEVGGVIILAVPFAACMAVLWKAVHDDRNPHAWRKR